MSVPKACTDTGKESWMEKRRKMLLKAGLQGESQLPGKYSAILISDLAGFTEFSRKITAEELYTNLQQYFEMMSSIIISQKGELVKTLGDGLLCHFPSTSNTKQDKADAIYNSVLAAIHMKIVESHFNSLLRRKNVAHSLPELKIRIAIHSGVIVSDILMKAPDVLGSHVNLTSRIIGKIGEMTFEEYETEPIMVVGMAKARVHNHFFWFPGDFEIKDIKGFGNLRLKLFEALNANDHKVTFSGTITSMPDVAQKHDRNIQKECDQIVYGPFVSRKQANPKIYVDYEIDLQKYNSSKYVLLQLPLLATSAGRYGESEKWSNLYFVHNGEEYLQIEKSSGVVFNEPKPYEYAPCIDLKAMGNKQKFSLDWLEGGKLRIFPILSNDGDDKFHIQPIDSRRWRRVYLGVLYIQGCKSR